MGVNKQILRAEAIVQLAYSKHTWLANDKAGMITRSPHDAPGVIPEFRARSNLWASLGVAQKQKKGNILSVTLSFHTGRGQRCHNLVLSPEPFSLVLGPWGRVQWGRGDTHRSIWVQSVLTFHCSCLLQINFLRKAPQTNKTQGYVDSGKHKVVK